MAQLTQLPANNMGAEARFHADNARRKSSERLNQRQSLDLATESIRPGAEELGSYALSPEADIEIAH